MGSMLVALQAAIDDTCSPYLESIYLESVYLE